MRSPSSESKSKDGAFFSALRLRLTTSTVSFAAFTVVFAVLAAFVFWGTWSLDFAPVMPDHGTTHAADSVARWFRGWTVTGKFFPGDLVDLTGMPYFWQELKFALFDYLAALALAWFLLGRGLSRPAAYGAGLLLGFSGYWLTLFSAGHFGWFQWMSCGVFAFGLADRAVRVGKLHHWLLLGAVVAWAGFNQPDLWLLFTVFTALYFFWRCWCERRFPWKGMLIAAVTFALIGLPNFAGLGAVVASRTNEVTNADAVAQKKSEGKTDEKAASSWRWEFVTNWSMPPEDTLEFLVPGVHGDTSCPLVLSVGTRTGSGVAPYAGRLGRPMNAKQGNYRQHSLYVGAVTLLFALVGVVVLCLKRKRTDCAFFAVAALVFYCFSLGRFFEPAYRLIFALPAGDLIRCPVKWHHLTEFSLAVLAAYGIDAVLARFQSVRWVLPAVVAVVVLGAADLARVDHRYCAPLNVGNARRLGFAGQDTILRRQDFQNPQLAEMARRGLVVSQANYLGNPDLFLVSVLKPFDKDERKAVPFAMALGVVSLLATLGVAAYGAKKAWTNS